MGWLKNLGAFASPDRLAALARAVPEPVMRAALASPARLPILATIFRLMPGQLRGATTQPDMVVRWNVSDGERTDTWFVVIEGGRCRSERKAEGPPRTTLTIAALDLIKLGTGALVPMAAFQEGRIKISGDLFFAAQMQSMFAIPV